MRKWNWRTHLIIVVALGAASGVMWAAQDWQLRHFRSEYPGVGLYSDECRTSMVGKDIEWPITSAENVPCLAGFGRFHNIRLTALPDKLPPPEWKLIPGDKAKWGEVIEASGHEPHKETLRLRFPADWAGRTATVRVKYDLTFPVSNDPGFSRNNDLLSYSRDHTFVELTTPGVDEFSLRIYGQQDIEAVSRYKTIVTVTGDIAIFFMVLCGGYILVLFLRFCEP